MAEPIPIRPGIAEPTWPAGFRSALTIMVQASADPRHDASATYARRGLQRILAILGDLGVHATIVWTAEHALANLDLLASVQNDGHDLAITVETIRDPTALSAALDDLAGRITGTPPGIVLPPSAAGAAGRLDALASALGDAGFGWIGDPFAATDLPEISGRGGTNVARLPLTPGTNDLAFERGGTTDSVMLSWRDDLDVVRVEGGYQTVQLAAWRSGRPGSSRAVQRFLDYAIDLGDIWIARSGDVATWWTRRDSGPASGVTQMIDDLDPKSGGDEE